MRFLHLSDLHIGLRLFNRDLYEDQRFMLSSVAEAAERLQPDALLIAGDIYDRPVPTGEAVEVFDSFISRLSEALPRMSIMVISGNHDSPSRISCFSSLLSGQNLYIEGLPPSLPAEHIKIVTLNDDAGPVNFYLLPFVRPSMVRNIPELWKEGRGLSYDEAVRGLISRDAPDTSLRNVIISHQFYVPAGVEPDDVERADSEIRTVGNIDEVGSDALAEFDYAALGHIHKPWKLSNTVRYCGSPMAYSAGEAGQNKHMLCVDLGAKGQVDVKEIPIPLLRGLKVIRGVFPDILEQACGDYVSIILEKAPEGVDMLDLNDRLRNAFPFLLEIRVDSAAVRGEGTDEGLLGMEKPDPFETARSFLKDAGEEEMEIMRDVVNTVISER